MTREDFLIIQALGECEILEVQSPSIIAYNLDMTRPHVSKRLSEFANRGVVEKVEDGKYRITDLGRAYLDGELKAERLENGI